MAENDRGADRDDTSKDGGAQQGLPYDPAVLAAKLAAAREQRRQVLAARAAAEGETTPQERRGKLPPFARPPEGPSPKPATPGAVPAAGEDTEPPRPPAPPDAAAPRQPAPLAQAASRAQERAAPGLDEPDAPSAGAPAPPPQAPPPQASPPQASPTVAAPRAAPPPSEGVALGSRTRAVPSAGADRTAARAAAAGIASARRGGKPRRRRPATVATPAAPPPPRTPRSAASGRSSSLAARLVPLSVLVIGWLLATLLFFSPSSVRQRIADAIAPPAPHEQTTPTEVPSPVPGAPDVHPLPRPSLGLDLSTPALDDPPAPVEPPTARAESPAPDTTSDAAATTAALPPGADAAVEPSAPRPDDTAAPVAASPRPDDTAAAPAVGSREPEPSTPAVGTAADADAPAGWPTPDAAADADAAGPAPVLGPAAATARVVLHFPASAAAVAGRVEATLRAAGVSEVTPVPAGFAISRTNVRYYRPEYRAVGEAVADVARHQLDGAPVETRDFTAFRPRPSPGTIEVWLAGGTEPRAPDMRTTASDAPAAAAREPEIAAPAVGPRAAPARGAERARLEDEVTRLLQDRLRDLQPE